MKEVEILEKSHSLSILLALYPDKTLSFSQLQKEINISSNSIDIRTKELFHGGLVNDIQEKKFQGKRFINLTTKGKNITNHLKAIEEILKN